MSLARLLTRILIIVALLAAGVSIAVALYVRTAVRAYEYVLLSDIPLAEAVIVPGASVFAGKPSPVLAARADMAIALYQAGKVENILVTGDDGTRSHDEVSPVRKYLVKAGIPSRDIFLDHAGFDTYSSMYRAKVIFGVRSAIVVTQDFHLSRSLFIARNLGIEAYGAVADDHGASWYDYAREIPASLKAVIDVSTHRTPRYLGDPISLSGDGRSTW